MADSATHPSMLKIHLKQSNCNQFGAGVDIVIGRTGCALCPVSALLSYISLRQDRPGAFFRNLEGRPITKAWFVSRIRAVLAVLGFPQHEYAGHSFRIGAATSAALAGIEDSTIQGLGRWQSAAFLQYIRMLRDHASGRDIRTAGWSGEDTRVVGGVLRHGSLCWGLRDSSAPSMCSCSVCHAFSCLCLLFVWFLFACTLFPVFSIII